MQERSGAFIVAVVGATAAGKSDLSLDLAAALGGEIVNTDAMQLYRGMDVGTAKLPVEDRRGIPHHLLDMFEVTEAASVAEFQTWARGLIAELRGRGATPVLVGGSALYTRAVVDSFEFPGTDPEIRERYVQQLTDVGAPGLHRLLAERDPEAAAGIEVGNGRRIVRALEVIELTGRPFSSTLPQLVYRDPATIQIGVDIDRPTLDERIERRVRLMFGLDDEAGLVAEVTRLLARGLADGLTASRAIGYREATAYLAGEIDREEAIRRTVVATRRFARRQDAWFRKDPRIVWVRWDDEQRLERALSAVRSGTVGGGL